MIGNVHPDIVRLSTVAREAMYAAIDICKPGTRFNTIGEVIEDYS